VPGGGHTEAMRDDALRDRLTAYIRNAVSPGGP
jgi:hypothetical protein